MMANIGKGKRKETSHYQFSCLECSKVVLIERVESSVFSLKHMLDFSGLLLVFSNMY